MLPGETIGAPFVVPENPAERVAPPPAGKAKLTRASKHLGIIAAREYRARRYEDCLAVLEARHILEHLRDGILYCRACPEYHARRMGQHG